MKTAVKTDIGWYTLLDAVDRLSTKIKEDCPLQFTLHDAERLEAVARLIRSTCPQESF